MRAIPNFAARIIISARESWLTNTIKNHPHLTVNDVNVIRTWMTFDYLNKLFTLPPEYLKARLRYFEPAYPKLTIGEFAKDINDNPPPRTLMEVQTPYDNISDHESSSREHFFNLDP